MEIPLTHGLIATIDDKNASLVSGRKWYAVAGANTWYAVAVTKKETLAMHRLIIGAKPDEQVDHIDRNGLNNLESNLRIATRQQQQANSVKRANTSSKYKGVCWNKNRNKWQAQIKLGGKQKHLGLFDTEEAAARAYDEAALNAFKGFAGLNGGLTNAPESATLLLRDQTRC